MPSDMVDDLVFPIVFAPLDMVAGDMGNRGNAQSGRMEAEPAKKQILSALADVAVEICQRQSFLGQ